MSIQALKDYIHEQTGELLEDFSVIREESKSLVRAKIGGMVYSKPFNDLSDWRACAEFARELTLTPLSFDFSTSQLLDNHGISYPQHMFKRNDDEKRRLEIAYKGIYNLGIIKDFSIDLLHIFYIALEEALYNYKLKIIEGNINNE